MRPHQRVAALDDAQGKLIDEAVLGAAQRRHIEPRRGEESARIYASTVRRIEYDRPAPLGRLRISKGGSSSSFNSDMATDWPRRDQPEQ